MNALLIVFTSIVCLNFVQGSLKSVHIVMRHGVRAPYFSENFYSNRIDESQWPNGVSQLTDVGIEQSVNMGKYIRDRYQDFYPKNNSKHAILHSVNVDRCLDTIALVSRQLWPPNDRENWTQPRIFSSPLPLDGTLNDRPYCPKRDQEFQNNLNKPEVVAFNLTHQDFYNYISNKSGVEPTFNGVLTAFDGYHCLKSSGYPIPDWVTEECYNKMAFVWYKYFQFRYTSEFAIKIKVGLLLQELKTRMDTVLQTNFETDRWYKNFFIYATHDFEIYGLNEALGVEQTNYPPFGAMIILELHEINNQTVVRVFYINQTESLPISGPQMKFSFCSDYDCPYETFTTSISKYFPDWMTDCGISKNYKFYSVLRKYVTITDDSGDYTPEPDESDNCATELDCNSAYTVNSLQFRAILSITLTFIAFDKIF